VYNSTLARVKQTERTGKTCRLDERHLMGLITRDMAISKAIADYPGTGQVFERFGMACGGCMGSLDETIENGARMHRVNLAELLNDLNCVASGG